MKDVYKILIALSMIHLGAALVPLIGPSRGRFQLAALCRGIRSGCAGDQPSQAVSREASLR